MRGPIRRRRPILRRSCAPSRRPALTSWSSAHTRPNSVGMVRAVNELGFKPKAIGGAMVGLQSTAVMAQLGPLLNGFINYELWLPVPKMQYSGVADLISRYQARAGTAEGVDPLGYYMPPWAYAQLQVSATGRGVDADAR